MRDFEVIVVDNSGSGRARRLLPPATRARVIENRVNVGFGTAVNQAAAASSSPFLAVINDDAIAHPTWLEALLNKIGDAGMCASQVRLHGTDQLDSAGMLISADGSSVQRNGGPPDALFPSGSAALYRRELFDQLGGFDDQFFLYCEDTDLGLRAQWAGWKCRYVADAIVDHRYSHSAGRASALKAFYVERNRLFVAIKNFPLSMLLMSPFASISRYFWHVMFLLHGRGKAAEFSRGGSGLMLAWFVLKAHWAAMIALPRLLSQRRQIRRKISSTEFKRILKQHWITPKQVASH